MLEVRAVGVAALGKEDSEEVTEMNGGADGTIVLESLRGWSAGGPCIQHCKSQYDIWRKPFLAHAVLALYVPMPK